MEYRVVKISSNLNEYPECKQDTEEFPGLIKYIEDEMDIFIVSENGDFFSSDEFFNMVSISKFNSV